LQINRRGDSPDEEDECAERQAVRHGAQSRRQLPAVRVAFRAGRLRTAVLVFGERVLVVAHEVFDGAGGEDDDDDWWIVRRMHGQHVSWSGFGIKVGGLTELEHDSAEHDVSALVKLASTLEAGINLKIHIRTLLAPARVFAPDATPPPRPCTTNDATSYGKSSDIE
jgi:hypothetical protein